MKLEVPIDSMYSRKRFNGCHPHSFKQASCLFPRVAFLKGFGVFFPEAKAVVFSTLPQLVVHILEMLTSKDNCRAGIDWKSQPVVEVHVIQPVVKHLREGDKTSYS